MDAAGYVFSCAAVSLSIPVSPPSLSLSICLYLSLSVSLFLSLSVSICLSICLRLFVCLFYASRSLSVSTTSLSCILYLSKKGLVVEANTKSSILPCILSLSLSLCLSVSVPGVCAPQCRCRSLLLESIQFGDLLRMPSSNPRV